MYATAHNLDTDTLNRRAALANFLDCPMDDISDQGAGADALMFEVAGAEYRVLTDREADETFREEVESYIEECILPEIDERFWSYFDYEAFVRDVQISDGRGPTLASYDGAEEEQKVGGTWFYIYRIN